MTGKYIIAPSILAADFARLGQDVEKVVSAGADWIHIDVMDNHYVPNLTFGPLVVRALRSYGIRAPMDVHLMVQPVDELITSFAEAGANYITFHPEASTHVERSIQLIHSLGCKAGVALNPSTPTTVLQYLLDNIDLVLVMTVKPGFGGQKFITEMLHKIKDVRQMIIASNRAIYLSVDGGISGDNAQQVSANGADVFVAGTAIFGAKDYGAAIQELRLKANNNA